MDVRIENNTSCVGDVCDFIITLTENDSGQRPYLESGHGVQMYLWTLWVYSLGVQGNVCSPKLCVACKKLCGLHMISVVTVVDAESDMVACHPHYKSMSGDYRTASFHQ